MNAGRRVLVADHLHARRFQGRELAFRRSLPKPDVGVKAGSPVWAGVARVLQPNGDREEPRIMGRAMLPFGIRTCGSSSPRRLSAGCAASTDQASDEQKNPFHTSISWALPIDISPFVSVCGPRSLQLPAALGSETARRHYRAGYSTPARGQREKRGEHATSAK